MANLVKIGGKFVYTLLKEFTDATLEINPITDAVTDLTGGAIGGGAYRSVEKVLFKKGKIAGYILDSDGSDLRAEDFEYDDHGNAVKLRDPRKGILAEAPDFDNRIVTSGYMNMTDPFYSGDDGYVDTSRRNQTELYVQDDITATKAKKERICTSSGIATDFEVSALPKSTWAFADLLEPGAMSGPDILYGAVKGLTVSAIKPAEKRIMGMLKKVPGNRNWDGVRNSLNNGIDELTKGLLGIKEAEYDGAAARWGIGERMSHG